MNGLEDVAFPETPGLIGMLGIFGEARLGEIKTIDEDPECGLTHLRDVYLDNEEIGYLVYDPHDKNLGFIGRLPTKEISSDHLDNEIDGRFAEGKVEKLPGGRVRINPSHEVTLRYDLLNKRRND